jgi:hypothetical protein
MHAGLTRWDDDCVYDEVTEQATCVGDAPPGYLDPVPPTYPMDVCVVIDEEPGTICIPGVLVWKPTDCDDSEEGNGVSVSVIPDCDDNDAVTLEITIDPPEEAFAGASIGALLSCPGTAEEGVYLCNPVPCTPDAVTTVQVHFGDRPTIERTFICPDCSADLRITHDCVEDATGALVPHLYLHYDPIGPAFVNAAANDVDLDCTVTVPGVADCHGLPDDGAANLGIVAVFDDGSTLNDTYPRPTCFGTVDIVPRWGIVPICFTHPDGSAEYYAAINTGMAGVVFIPDSWSFTGVPEPKDCDLEDPPLAGIWGCTFPIGAHTTVEFCAAWEGDPPPGHHCQEFNLEPILPPDCSQTPGDDDEPGMGWCVPGQTPGSCGPCRPQCPATYVCNPCTLP